MPQGLIINDGTGKTIVDMTTSITKLLSVIDVSVPYNSSVTYTVNLGYNLAALDLWYAYYPSTAYTGQLQDMNVPIRIDLSHNNGVITCVVYANGAFTGKLYIGAI